MTPEQLFDMPTLTTLAGLSAAVYVLTSTITGLFPSLPPRPVSAVCALAVSLLVSYFTSFTAPNVLLAVLNAALAHLVATGAANHVPARVTGTRFGSRLWRTPR